MTGELPSGIMADGRDRVLLVAHGMQRTGAPLVLLTYARWLRRHGVTVETLALSGGELWEDFAAVGPIHRFPAWRAALQRLRFGRLRLADRRLGTALAQLEEAACGAWIRARFSRVHLVHANTVHAGWLRPHFSSLGTPFVLHVHELPFWIEHHASAQEVEAALRSDLIVCVSEAGYRYFSEARGVPKSRLLVIPPMVDRRSTPEDGRRQFRAHLGIDAETFVVGGCGTVDWRKGPDLFLRVAMEMTGRDTGRDWLFLWLGGSLNSVEMAQLNYDCHKVALTGRVRFLGSLSDPVAAGWYAALDAFALTSREDPFPLVMQEAAQARLPIVGFEGSGGADEFVLSGETGQLVPYGDCAAMADLLTTWSGDDSLREALGGAAQEALRQGFDPDELCDRLYEYERRLARRG